VGQLTTAFHGTPITPTKVFEALCKAPRHFCVSYFRDDQIELVAEKSASFFIDCGAFSAWKKGLLMTTAYWAAYYKFVRRWYDQCAWFVIPDEIGSGTQAQEALLRECPADLLPKGWPVWHTDEPVSRALDLVQRFGRLCVGAVGEHEVIGSDAFRARMDELFNAIWATFGLIPPIHMFRGLRLLLPSYDYPISSADSTNIGRNHNRMKKHGDRRIWAIVAQTDRWDALNCPTTWPPTRLTQKQLAFA
jgi:hypothetical protein